jgi:methionyl-tRNA formyltransferase
MIIIDTKNLMDRKDFRIIFMGTPDFATGTLKKLVEENFRIEAVVTAPPKPAGRGQQIHQPSVCTYAVSENIPVLQPLSLKDPDFIEQLSSFSADLFVVVAFRMLPEQVWKIPPSGTINLHASLLPDYRGAAPIQHAIIQGEKITGVTTFFIEKEIDTGMILLQDKVEISPDDNGGSLHEKLMNAGADLLVKTIDRIIEKNLTPVPQSTLIHDEKLLKTAPKIFREHCRIDFTKSVNTIHNLIRGLSPHPSAWAILKKNNIPSTIRIFRSLPEHTFHSYPPGSVISDHKNHLKVAVMDGFIHLLELQPESRKKMNISEFLRGTGNSSLHFE